MRTSPILLVTAAVALLVSACGGGSLPGIDDPTGGGAAGAGGGELPACPEYDAPRSYDPPPAEQPTPDPASTAGGSDPDLPVSSDDAGAAEPRDGEGHDRPVDDRPTAPDGGDAVGQARAWAEREAPEHFAGLWQDNEHGALVIAFTEDVDAYAEEVRSRFGPSWWVVRGERSVAELAALADAVAASGAHADAGQPGSIVSWGPREDRGVVGIEVVGGDDHALGELAAEFDDPAYCLAVLDPPARPDGDGAVRTLATVAGWPEGAVEPERGARLEIAYDEASAQRLVADHVPDDLDPAPADEPWTDGRHGDLDDVDLDTHVVAVYTAGRSGSCPEWVAEVTTTEGGVAVTTEVPTRGACTDDFNPYRTVIAIERDRVPPADELPTALDLGYDTAEGAVVAYPVEE